ncbi:MAG: hypothetical protein L0Y56_22400 [Nitrospira sp.]|nr:hypothetical protein [Nitrospira sp.]
MVDAQLPKPISIVAITWDRLWTWLGLVLAILLTLYVHTPSLYLGFAGDDFQNWQLARRALDDPVLLLTAPGTFYRPANTWFFALGHLLFGTEPGGYHLMSLLLHLTCGGLFWLFLGHFSLSAPACAAVAILWLCSPYSLETAQWVTTGYDLILPICWLSLALIWPNRQEPWSYGKLLTAFLLAGLTVFTKESWIVLPAFIFCFDLCLRQTSLQRALRNSLLVALAPLAYILIYVLVRPLDTVGYYAGGLKAVAKIPHAWTVFFNLTPLHPVNIPFGVPEIISLAIMGSLAWLGWRRRSTFMGIGFAFFFLPFIPVLPVAYLPSRYTTIPLMGFLMVAGAGVQELLASLKGWRQQVTMVAVGALILLMLAANLAWLQGDMVDAQRYYEAHDQLLAEARVFLPYLPQDRVIVAVRLENKNPLLELVFDFKGVSKLYYPRHPDPYNLIDWAALLSYTLEPMGGLIYVEIPLDEAKTGDYLTIGHIQGNFVRLLTEAPTAYEAAVAWKSRPAYVRLLKPWQPSP